MIIAPLIQLNSKKAVMQYFQDDKDFIVLDIFNGYGKPVNKTELLANKIKYAEIRYGKNNEKVMGLPLNKQ